MVPLRFMRNRKIIFEFLELKKNHGNELEKARDLFYALWIPDLFMEKVQRDEDWCLFSSNDCPGLSDCWGNAFNELYFAYEKEQRYIKQVKARDLWFRILTCQIETGTPYLLYKDVIVNQINKIWEPLNHPIYVQRLWNIPVRKKPYVIWHPYL